MNFLFMTTSQHNEHGVKVSASSVFRSRLEKNVWAIYENTRNKKLISENDNVVFYVSDHKAGGQLCGIAVVDERRKPLRNERFHSEHGAVEYFISFKDVTVFDATIKFRDIITELSFCPKNLAKWGVILMGGVRRLNDEDFDLIRQRCLTLNR